MRSCPLHLTSSPHNRPTPIAHRLFLGPNLSVFHLHTVVPVLSAAPLQSKWNDHKEERTLNGGRNRRFSSSLLFTTTNSTTAVTSPGFRWRRRRRRSQCSGGGRARARERLPGQRPSARRAAVGAPAAAAGKRDSARPSFRERRKRTLQSKAESGAGKTCVTAVVSGQLEREGRKGEGREESAPLRTGKDLSPPPPPPRPLLRRRLLRAGRPHQRPANGSGPTACV